MLEYSGVGVASALIAAGIAILQFVLPNALALVLSSNLSETHSAVTWSVVSRFILSTDWPLFLRSDHVASSSVAPKIAAVTWTKPLGLLLAAVAAVVTPLGLYDGIFPSRSPELVTFVHVVDGGAIGSGTPARSDLGFSRVCGYHCPGEPDLGNVTFINPFNTSEYENDVIRTPDIAQSLVDLYQSGLRSQMPTVSGFFDIQYRQWDTDTNNYTVNNSSFIVPTFKTLTSLLLDNKYDLIDGLIADFKNGGIGFRNHTVPTGLQYGAEWEEDILWWQPEIQCVNMNISISMAVNKDSYNPSFGIADRGGFVNINRTNPYPSATEPLFQDGQAFPSLYERAYSAAWGTNVLIMQYLNLTTPHTNLSRIDSKFGQQYMLNLTKFTAVANPSDFANMDRVSTLDIASAPFTSNASDSGNPAIPNPWNITSDMFYSLQTDCQGLGGLQQVNISTIGVDIGVIAAPATQTGGNPTNDLQTVGTTWERPLYVCAGATKASIKTFHFRYNATHEDTLSNLFILDVNDKEYNDSSTLPIWGYETPQPPWNISWINPLWGFIDNSQSSKANLSTYRQDHFYIPAGDAALFNDVGLPESSVKSNTDNVPGITSPTMLWAQTMGASTNGFDYSGNDNLPLFLLWQDLLKSANGTGQALRLIWTDLAANFLVGTKGIGTPLYKQPSSAPKVKRQSGNGTDAQFPVYVLSHRLRYRWIYGIPALLCVSIVGLAVLIALFAWVCGHGTIDRLRYFMYSISSGRVLAASTYPDEGENRQATTKDWIKAVGHKPVQVMARSSAVNFPYHYGDTKQPQYVQVKQQEDPLIPQQP